jgi:tetratricopeptide (TPR) repeat protein
MWFIKSSVAKSGYVLKTKNDSIVVATHYFTPTINKNFAMEITSKFMDMEYYPNFEIKGNIIISPKKKKVDLLMEDNDDNIKKNTKYIEVVKSIIENSFPFWGLTDFKNFEKVYIPYYMKFKSNKGGERHGITFSYFNDSLKNINHPGKEIIRQDSQLSNQNFDKGLEAFEKQKYDQAVEFFNKAHELDNTNIDSLYNIVAIYSSKNDLKNACIALKKLKDLEQTDGIKMFNEKCTNINP